MKLQLTIATLLLAAAVLASEARAQVNVVLRLVDQNDVEIAGALIFGAGVGVETGTQVSLPEGSFDFTLIPFLGSSGLLARIETAVVDASTTELKFQWITQRNVSVTVVDQFDVALSFPPAVAAGLNTTGPPLISISSERFLSGEQVDLPIVDPAVYPNLTGAFADGYDFRVFPFATGGLLDRTISNVVVTASTTAIDLEWTPSTSP